MSTSGTTAKVVAGLLTKDVSESGNTIKSEDCIVLQHFNYQCGRKRTVAGIPYGPTQPSYLDFTVRVSSNKDEGKILLERAGLNKPFRYSFLFDAEFKNEEGDTSLTGYGDAMVVTGYIVEMEEFYDAPTDSNSGEQSLLRCRLLLCSIYYLGSGKNNATLTITED